jgi:hypothetical protein
VEEGARKEWLVAPEEPSAKITLAPVNFVASDIGESDRARTHAVLAHIAAATLAERGVHTLVVTADNTVNTVNIPALDKATFPMPVGSCRFIVVGKEAFDLLPERTQKIVFDPPQPEKSNYFDAVGRDFMDFDNIEDKLVGILNMIAPRSGAAYKERIGAFFDSV